MIQGPVHATNRRHRQRRPFEEEVRNHKHKTRPTNIHATKYRSPPLNESPWIPHTFREDGRVFSNFNPGQPNETRNTGSSKAHFTCMSLRRSVSASALFMEGVTRSAYKIARPASCLVALPIVCSNAVSLRRNPSASASRIQTRDTSGRFRPCFAQSESARVGGASRA